MPSETWILWNTTTTRKLFATLALGAAMGCGGGAASSPPASSATTTAAAQTPEDMEVTAGLHEYHRHHHHGGVTLLIALSLDTLGVPPEKHDAIEKIKAELHGKMEPSRAAEQALHVVLADGVAAGAIDQAKLDAALAQLTAAATAVHNASIEALNQLHAALSPAERAALVDKVEAHVTAWQEANAEEQKGATGRPREGGHLAKLAREIDLTQDQLDKIHASLEASGTRAKRVDEGEIAAHVKAFGDAFRGETFDAKSVTTAANANAHLAAAGADRMVRFYTAVAPTLTAEQRTKLSAILREHANVDVAPKGG
jgi:Spy/CpxP family protein refolding chaperone